jgi:hypothetical protein
MSDLGKLRRRLSIGALYLFVLFSLTIAGTRANALTVANFDVSFSGPGISASGVFQIGNNFASPPQTVAGPLGCALFNSCTSEYVGILSGTLNGNPMTYLSAGTVCNFASSSCPVGNLNDNLGEVLNNGSNIFYEPDGLGDGLSAGGVNYNLNLDQFQLCSATSCTTLTSYSAVPATGATPLSAALPLFATGLGGLGLLGWRRKRKVQAVA